MPGTPVDAGQVQVTAKSNGSNANARQFWLTSSAHQGVRAYEDDDGVEHNVQWRVN